MVKLEGSFTNAFSNALSNYIDNRGKPKGEFASPTPNEKSRMPSDLKSIDSAFKSSGSSSRYKLSYSPEDKLFKVTFNASRLPTSLLPEFDDNGSYRKYVTDYDRSSGTVTLLIPDTSSNESLSSSSATQSSSIGSHKRFSLDLISESDNTTLPPSSIIVSIDFDLILDYSDNSYSVNSLDIYSSDNYSDDIISYHYDHIIDDLLYTIDTEVSNSITNPNDTPKIQVSGDTSLTYQVSDIIIDDTGLVIPDDSIIKLSDSSINLTISTK